MAGLTATLPSSSLTVDGSTLCVKGALTKATVAGLLPQGRAAVASLAPRTGCLDLSGVTSSETWLPSCPRSLRLRVLTGRKARKSIWSVVIPCRSK